MTYKQLEDYPVSYKLNNNMNFKQLAKSKTLWTGISTIALGLGLFFSGEQNLEELIIAIMGVAFSILRFKTDKPLGSL